MQDEENLIERGVAREKNKREHAKIRSGGVLEVQNRLQSTVQTGAFLQVC